MATSQNTGKATKGDVLQSVIIVLVLLTMIPGLFFTMVLTVHHLKNGEDILSVLMNSCWPLLTSFGVGILLAVVLSTVANFIEARQQ